jgi:hypothetical protein
MTFDPYELERMSSTLLRAMSEAQAMIAADNIGPELADLLEHVREMHELMTQSVAEAGDEMDPRASQILILMGQSVRQLQEAVSGNVD